MRGGARGSQLLAPLTVAAVARERTPDCRGDLFRLGVHGDDRASLQQLAEVERLADRRRDDEGRTRVASSEPAQDLTPVLLFEVERGDNEVSSLDGNAGLEPMEGAARRRISGRVEAPADPDRAARLPDRGREPQPRCPARMLDQHARPLRVRSRLQVDRDGPLPHRPSTVTADGRAHIRARPNNSVVRSTDGRADWTAEPIREVRRSSFYRT
jgi:hypothetical protein